MQWFQYVAIPKSYINTMQQFSLLQFATLHNVAIQFATIQNCSKIIIIQIVFYTSFSHLVNTNTNILNATECLLYDIIFLFTVFHCVSLSTL